MTARSHTRHVVDQFGAQASAYVTSAVHAAGADLDRIGARVRARPGLRVLDLGCGGGHVAFTAAAAGAAVTAYDLSAEMLAAVAAEASRRGPRGGCGACARRPAPRRVSVVRSRTRCCGCTGACR